MLHTFGFPTWTMTRNWTRTETTRSYYILVRLYFKGIPVDLGSYYVFRSTDTNTSHTFTLQQTLTRTFIFTTYAHILPYKLSLIDSHRHQRFTLWITFFCPVFSVVIMMEDAYSSYTHTQTQADSYINKCMSSPFGFGL
jgi:hypothetical protein